MRFSVDKITVLKLFLAGLILYAWLAGILSFGYAIYAYAIPFLSTDWGGLQ